MNVLLNLSQDYLFAIIFLNMWWVSWYHICWNVIATSMFFVCFGSYCVKIFSIVNSSLLFIQKLKQIYTYMLKYSLKMLRKTKQNEKYIATNYYLIFKCNEDNSKLKATSFLKKIGPMDLTKSLIVSTYIKYSACYNLTKTLWLTGTIGGVFPGLPRQKPETLGDLLESVQCFL